MTYLGETQMNEICLSCRKHTKCGRAEHETIGCGYYVPMTNEEWLKSKDTADLAEWIYNAMFNKSCQNDVADGAYMQMMTKKDYIESWLCEVHDDSMRT